MQKSKMAIVAALAATCVSALAADPPKSDWTIAGNAGLFSDYRFRGISQTNKKPAFQGGLDISHASGFYVGNWNSNIDSAFYNGSNLEMDFYGGYKKSVGDLGFDVGLLQYYYPGAKTGGGEKYDTLEGYIGASWKWLSAKYSYTFSDYFGLVNSDGSGYLDLAFTMEVAPKLNLVAHYGMQTVKNYDPLDYNDWKLGVTYDLAGWILGAAYVDTDADKGLYTLTNSQGKSKDLGGSTVVLSIMKTF